MGLEDLKRLTIRVRPEMHEWLINSAEARGLTMNAMVIFAIETYVQQQQMMGFMPDMLRELNKEQEQKKEK
jgi:predicted DNA-binding protein